MTNLIKSSFNEEIAIILQEQWTKQCKAGELKSKQEFSKKEQRFKENWMSVSKFKHAGDRYPNKQENSIHYRTYYKRTKERTLADLILGTEEINKDTTEIEGMTTLTTK